ncbi:MAG TPA: hypothetical protein PKA16_04145 [Ottowia sp.]|uniref:hypothetical protein n=1 Tax=Ottowia sp. TaxID=1898956 RepID=UPI002CB6C136|nr:hypothetical protein [Ottowia sp.]HMN20566.1 hypothetical protein [Ottowia sp.]
MLPEVMAFVPALDAAKITVAMTRLDAIRDQPFPAEQTRIAALLVEKAIVSPNDIKVRLRANGIERLPPELRPEPVQQGADALA